MTKKIQSIPEARLLLESLRSVGYNEETAIADIIDNCISAKAHEIKIQFDWEKKRIVISDDGLGMSSKDLIENMRIGSSDPNQVRDERDLGRFGMGMKTAAFSLGKKLTVVTKSNSTVSNASWDLEQIPSIGWNLIIRDESEISEFSSQIDEQGTVVIIENLDRVIDTDDEKKAKNKFYRIANRTEKHLALTFHRFIEEDCLILELNDIPIKAWNPFIVENSATQELPEESVFSDNGCIKAIIQPYVLPHKTKFASDDDYQLAGGPKGWNYHQGIYVYRNKRLIICGTWFDYIKKEPAYNLARIKIDISSASDEDWKIDIKKSTASLPSYVREAVEREIDLCTEASARVYNSRGNYSKSKAYMFDCAKTIARSPSAITANIWPEDCYVSLNVVYKMSKNHQKLLKTLKKHKKKLLEYADVYADERKKSDIESNDIALRSYEAFSAIKQFFDEKLEADKLKDVIEPAIMIQRMLSKSKEIFDNHLVVDKCDYAENGDLVAYIKSYAVFDYLKALLGTDSNGYEINQDVLCAADFGAPQKRKRFIVIGIKKSLTDTVQLPIGIFSEKDYRTVQDAIGDLQNVPTVTDVAEDIGTPLKKADDISELGKSLRDTDTLFNHIITKTRETAMERFKVIKQGENFHSLNDSLKTNTYTDANRTQNTIYLRLAYNQPSGTVVNVRKSMWIHPELNRAISIREAARLQTFPDSFIFCGSKDKQYQQVGNAVPPIMAKAIAEKLADQLEQIEKRYER